MEVIDGAVPDDAHVKGGVAVRVSNAPARVIDEVGEAHAGAGKRLVRISPVHRNVGKKPLPRRPRLAERGRGRPARLGGPGGMLRPGRGGLRGPRTFYGLRYPRRARGLLRGDDLRRIHNLGGVRRFRWIRDLRRGRDRRRVCDLRTNVGRRRRRETRVVLCRSGGTRRVDDSVRLPRLSLHHLRVEAGAWGQAGHTNLRRGGRKGRNASLSVRGRRRRARRRILRRDKPRRAGGGLIRCESIGPEGSGCARLLCRAALGRLGRGRRGERRARGRRASSGPVGFRGERPSFQDGQFPGRVADERSNSAPERVSPLAQARSLPLPGSCTPGPPGRTAAVRTRERPPCWIRRA